MSNQLGLLQHAAQQFAQTFSTLKANKTEKQYNEYLTIFSQAESMDKAAPPEGANMGVWNKAAVDHVSKELAEGSLKQQRFDLIKGEMGAKREMIMENARKAESLVPTNAGAALDTYMQSFSAHPNGIEVKKNAETGMWDFENTMSGNKWSKNVTLDDARQMTQAMMAPGEYEKIYLGDRSRVTNFNKVSMLNPDIMADPDGKQVAVYTLLDPNTGSKVIKVEDGNRNLVDLNQEDILHGRYKMVKDAREERLAELGMKKAELGIERQEQEIAHADRAMGLRERAANVSETKATKRTGKPTAREEIMAAYDVDGATAMDILRSDKSLGDRLSMAKAEIHEGMLDPEKQSDIEKIAEILKKFNVDQLPGHEGYGREQEQPDVRRGLQDDPAEATPADEPVKGKFISAQDPSDKGVAARLQKAFPDVPDGSVKYQKTRKFVKTNGQWKRVKD